MTKPKEICNRTAWKSNLKSFQGDLQITCIYYTLTEDFFFF